MISYEKIKEDLRELKYYYSRKSNMEKLFFETGKTDIPVLAEKYNCVIRTAPARLYDLYGCLYIQNKTQEAVAMELCYTPEYIRRLKKELIDFLRKKINS